MNCPTCGGLLMPDAWGDPGLVCICCRRSSFRPSAEVLLETPKNVRIGPARDLTSPSLTSKQQRLRQRERNETVESVISCW